MLTNVDEREICLRSFAGVYEEAKPHLLSSTESIQHELIDDKSEKRQQTRDDSFMAIFTVNRIKSF